MKHIKILFNVHAGTENGRYAAEMINKHSKDHEIFIESTSLVNVSSLYHGIVKQTHQNSFEPVAKYTQAMLLNIKTGTVIAESGDFHASNKSRLCEYLTFEAGGFQTYSHKVLEYSMKKNLNFDQAFATFDKAYCEFFELQNEREHAFVNQVLLHKNKKVFIVFGMGHTHTLVQKFLDKECIVSYSIQNLDANNNNHIKERFFYETIFKPNADRRKDNFMRCVYSDIYRIAESKKINNVKLSDYLNLLNSYDKDNNSLDEIFHDFFEFIMVEHYIKMKQL